MCHPKTHPNLHVFELDHKYAKSYLSAQPSSLSAFMMSKHIVAQSLAEDT